MRAVYNSKKSSFSKNIPELSLFIDDNNNNYVRYSFGGIPNIPEVDEIDYNNAKELFSKVLKDSLFLFDISSWSSIAGGIRRV
jgi:hypothetical protein